MISDEVKVHILSELQCSIISNDAFYSISEVSDCISPLYTTSLVDLHYTMIRNIPTASFQSFLSESMN